MRAIVFFWALLLFLAACGAPVSGTDAGAGGGGGGGAGGGTAGGAAGGAGGGVAGGLGGGQQDAGAPDGGCPRSQGPADGVRRVVVSHPYPDDGGSKDNRYEVFTLSPTGALTATNQYFRMGRTVTSDSPMAFTPDGKVGLVAQEGGSLGVFRFDEQGQVTVVHASFTADFYAGQVLVSAAGDQAYVLDANTLANGGGVYRVDIGCDGTLSNVQQLLAGDVTTAAAWVSSGRTQLALSARSLTGTPVGQDLHLVDVGPGAPVVTASAAGFPDRDAYASAVAVSADQRWVAMADNGFAAGNRLAVFEKIGATLTGRQVLTTPNPVGLAFSPFGTWGLVVNSDGADQYRRLDFGAGSFSVASTPLPYAHGRPQLPGAPAMIARGALQGRLLIPELDAIRQLQFEVDGGISDVAKTPAGGVGNAQIVGALGVTP